MSKEPSYSVIITQPETPMPEDLGVEVEQLRLPILIATLVSRDENDAMEALRVFTLEPDELRVVMQYWNTLGLRPEVLMASGPTQPSSLWSAAAAEMPRLPMVEYVDRVTLLRNEMSRLGAAPARGVQKALALPVLTEESTSDDDDEVDDEAELGADA
jgi:hypothetical protein